MQLLTNWPSMRTVTGAVLTLLAAALCAPAARGSCGHYVLVGAKAAATAQPDAPLPVSKDQPVSAPEEKPRPCSGPFCSRGPAGLPIAPPATAPAQGEQWGCMVGLSALPTSGPVTSLAAEPAPRPLRHGSGVYHPPR
jgi:hypothetical protein